jgi:hypothetical protein
LEFANGLKQENKAEVSQPYFNFSSRGPYPVDSGQADLIKSTHKVKWVSSSDGTGTRAYVIKKDQNKITKHITN